MPVRDRQRPPRHSPPRVVIADSHAPARAGLHAVLEDGGLRVCAEAADATGGLAAAVRETPDIAVVSSDLEGGGLALTGEIARGLPSVRIVMLAGEPDDEEMLQALRLGASGYLPKAMGLDRLAVTLTGVLAGEAALPRGAVGRLVQEYNDRAHRRLTVPGHPSARLTAREWDVLELLRDGLGTAEIAARLGISQVTVRRHASSIVHKLDAPDRRAAVRLVAAPDDPDDPDDPDEVEADGVTA